MQQRVREYLTWLKLNRRRKPTDIASSLGVSLSRLSHILSGRRPMPDLWLNDVYLRERLRLDGEETFELRRRLGRLSGFIPSGGRFQMPEELLDVKDRQALVDLFDRAAGIDDEVARELAYVLAMLSLDAVLGAKATEEDTVALVELREFFRLVAYLDHLPVSESVEGKSARVPNTLMSVAIPGYVDKELLLRRLAQRVLAIMRLERSQPK